MVKTYELREKNEAKLLESLNKLRKELLELRAQQVIGAQATKLLKIKTVRKDIARVLTVYTEKRRAEAKSRYEGKKFVPKDLKKKTTRAMRRCLTLEQANRKSVKAQKKASNLPIRRFALLASAP